MDNFGTGVSRVLDPQQAGYTQVIFQQGKPPTDHELNLLQQIDTDWRKQFVVRNTPSGWLGNETNPTKDFVTNPNWSNWFQFGTQRSGEKKSIMWAVVNGWLVPVTGTKTGTPPGSPNDTDSWNKITLDPPPSNSGDFRSDFVFLEVWQARVAPNPSTSNKPSASAVHRYGNVEGGYSYLSDDIQDPQLGFDTTQRVQVQYRVRVVKGLIGLSTYPDGFDPTVVKARGAATAETSYTFTNMRNELGDPGLWRAGDGTANSLGSVDGYVYAIPLCVAFRRNSVTWAGDPSQNLNGGFNRNPLATDRTGIKTFSTTPTLLSAITDTSTSLTLVSASDIPLPAAPTSPVLIQIGDELLTYGGSGTAISGNVVSNLVRGVNGTKAEAHPVGAVVRVVSGRPDGLFSDQVAGTDLLDLRHLVNPNGFDHSTLLQHNLDKLLRGQLRSNWKRSGGGPQGTFVTYQDRVSASVSGLGVTKVDSPDNIRMIYSDAAVQQRVELICTPHSNSIATPSSQPVVTTWSLALSASITRQRTGNQWDTETAVPAVDADYGSRIKIDVAQFKNTVPGGDSDQVRILNEVSAEGSSGVATGNTVFTHAGAMGSVRPGDTLVVFTGAAQGTYAVVSATADTCTVDRNIPAAAGVTYVVRKGRGSIEVRVDGQEGPLPPHRFKVTPSNPTPTDDVSIEFAGAGAPFPLTAATGNNVYITAHIQYGSGRGVSRRPDSLHSILLTNPNSDLMVQQHGVTSATLPSLRTAWAPLWSKYRNGSYKSLLPVTAEAYSDLGSKTVILSPFRRVTFPTALMTVDGSAANPYLAAVTTGTAGSSSGTTLTDGSKDYTALGVITNDVLIINSGLGVGRYRVVTAGTTTLTVDRDIPTTTGITYEIRHAQGVMPLNKLDGTTVKWASTDPLGLFSGTTEGAAATKNFYVTLPRHLVPGWGAVHVPILPNNGAVFHKGVNFMLQAREGLNTGVTNPDHNPIFINYTNGTLSYAAMSTGNFSGVSTVPSTYNSTFTYGGNTFAGSRFFTDQRGLGRKGIELPPFYGAARVFGVYESADYKANGSAVNPSTREFTGGGAKNLLRNNFTGPTFWVEIDDDGDSTFILNADVLDLSKSPTPISTFESAHYVVEASVFGFDRGSFDLSKPFRMVLSRNRSVANSGTRASNVTSVTGPVAIIPAPMTASDTALVNYSRTPYQGDPWGSQSSYVDSGYSPGPLTSSVAYQVASSGLSLSTLTRPNQKPLEVLASVGFMTTLGTGRISGDLVRTNDYDFRNVAYEDLADFPPTSGVAARPDYKIGYLAVTEETSTDVEVGPDYLGCTERLPLGSMFKDKDFRGGRFSNSNRSPLTYTNNVGVGLGTASQSRTTSLEQSEVDLHTASLTPGLAGDVLVHVDGETGNYALLTNFRTHRGGSVFVGSGARPGGEVYATHEDIHGTGRGTRAVVGRAYLVRNAPTNVGANEASAGDELMLLVVTSATEVDSNGQVAQVLIGTNGSGEGSSAADLYRIEGHPLVSNHVRYEVNPASIALPNRVIL